MCDNDFGTMIEDLVIVTNSKLKIENVNRQQYYVSEVMKKLEMEQMKDKLKNSQSNFTSKTGNPQAGYPIRFPAKGSMSNKQSLKNLIFNVNSELNVGQGDNTGQHGHDKSNFGMDPLNEQYGEESDG